MKNEFPIEISKTQKRQHLVNLLWNGLVWDSKYLRWIHADPSFGDHITDESHVVLIEFVFLHLGVELVVTQNLKNGANMLDVECRVF